MSIDVNLDFTRNRRVTSVNVGNVITTFGLTMERVDFAVSNQKGLALTPQSEFLSTALPDGEHTREKKTQRSPQKPRSSPLARRGRLALTRQ